MTKTIQDRIVANDDLLMTDFRRESELMEDLRHGEEVQALEKWKKIINFCKEVIHFLKNYNSQFLFL